MVSRRHAVIEQRGSQFFLRDCDSANGSVVNGDRVGERGLRDGDLVAIGSMRLLFREDLAEPGAKVVPHPSAAPMHCPECGADYRRGDVFCRECGEQVARPSGPPKAVCSSCGSAVPLPARYCNACGDGLPEGESPESESPAPPARTTEADPVASHPPASTSAARPGGRSVGGARAGPGARFATGTATPAGEPSGGAHSSPGAAPGPADRSPPGPGRPPPVLAGASRGFRSPLRRRTGRRDLRAVGAGGDARARRLLLVVPGPSPDPGRRALPADRRHRGPRDPGRAPRRPVSPVFLGCSRHVTRQGAPGAPGGVRRLAGARSA